MIIRNFNPLHERSDVGALWENFLIAERIKQNAYKQIFARTYFWRTKQQQEVDFVEEVNGKMVGYEFNWNPAKKVKLPKTFTDTYNAESVLVSKENFREFMM